MDLIECNTLIQTFAEVIDTPAFGSGKGRRKLYTGVDLGTAYIVLAVVDEEGQSIAGAYQFAQVVRDGLVVDYRGAVKIVKQLKQKIEEQLNEVLTYGAVAYPPGTGISDCRAIKYVAEAAGFEIIAAIDEPTAANAVLKIENGAVVDIGGGTTGTAVIKNNVVVHVEDEPTGGTQFSLVIAGSKKISFEKAEEIKKDPRLEEELLPIIKPVMQKVATIIRSHLQGYAVEAVYLVGGTSTNKYIGKVIEEETGFSMITPVHPFLITPLGIALYTRQADSDSEANYCRTV